MHTVIQLARAMFIIKFFLIRVLQYISTYYMRVVLNSSKQLFHIGPIFSPAAAAHSIKCICPFFIIYTVGTMLLLLLPTVYINFCLVLAASSSSGIHFRSSCRQLQLYASLSLSHSWAPGHFGLATVLKAARKTPARKTGISLTLVHTACTGGGGKTPSLDTQSNVL